MVSMENKLIQPLLEQKQNTKVAKKKHLNIYQNLNVFRIAREQWENEEWWENLWLRVNDCMSWWVRELVRVSGWVCEWVYESMK